MTAFGHPESAFHSARDDAQDAESSVGSEQTRSPSYRLAYNDTDFMLRDELRSVRLQLELLKPDLVQQDQGIVSTIVLFGSTRIPDQETAQRDLDKLQASAAASPGDAALERRVGIARRILAKSFYYDEARRLAAMVTEQHQGGSHCELVVITGGGSGIMEAANRGAFEAGGKSIGLNIVLPREQGPNPYITPELCFQFHYFAIRKMHFLLRAKALIAFPGGFGTLDELFETLTLIQTRKVEPVPVMLFGKEYWDRIIDFQALVEEGTIDEKDLEIFSYVETAEEAWERIEGFYGAGWGESESCVRGGG